MSVEDFLSEFVAATDGVEVYGQRGNSLCRISSNFYQEDEWSTSKLVLQERWYPIIRKTPAGCWISDFGKERFILNDARKKWAYPTRELALNSFQIRKRWQISHLERQLEHAKSALAKTQELLK